MSSVDFSKTQEIPEAINFNRESLSALKQNRKKFNFNKIKVNVLNSEKIVDLAGKINSANVSEDQKPKLLNLLNLYQNVKIFDESWTGWGINLGLNAVKGKLIGNRILGVDQKVLDIIDVGQNSIKLIIKYFDQSFFDLNQAFESNNQDQIDKKISEIENFLNSSVLKIENSEDITLGFLIEKFFSSDKKTEEVSPEDSSGLRLHEVLNIIFELSSISSFNNILTELKNQIKQFEENPTNKIDLTEIFLNNIFDLLIDSSEVLENKEKIEKLFKYFGLNLKNDQESLFKNFFESFSYHENELIIKNYEKFNEFFGEFTKFSISDKDLNPILLGSNEISKQIFSSNIEDENKEIKIKINDEIKTKINSIIKTRFVTDLLNESINKDNFLNKNFQNNKDLIKILLNFVDHIKNDQDPKKNKKALFSIIEKGLNIDNLNVLKNFLNNNENLQNDFIDLFILFHDKLIYGFYPELAKTNVSRNNSVGSDDSNDSGMESEESNFSRSTSINSDDQEEYKNKTNELFYTSKENNNKELLSSPEILDGIIDGIISKNKNSKEAISKVLNLTLQNQPELEKKLFNVIKSFDYENKENNPKILIKPKKLFESIKDLIEFLDSKEIDEKKKKEYELTKQSLELTISLLNLNEFNDQEKQININNSKEFRQEIKKILHIDLIYESIESILKNEKITDLDEANDKITNLQKKIENQQNKINELKEEIENKNDQIKRQNEEQEKSKTKNNNEKENLTNAFKTQLNQKENKFYNKEYKIYSAGFVLFSAGFFANAMFLKSKEIISKPVFGVMIGISIACILISGICFKKSRDVSSKIEVSLTQEKSPQVNNI